MPLVSVVVPCYNYGRYLREAVESVLSQTVPDVEVIIVDDGSTDETPVVVSALADPKVRAVRTENRGIGPARNVGLDLAGGEYIAFLDADDRWLPNKLALQVGLIEQEPEVGFVFSNFSRFDDHGPFPLTQFDFIPEIGNLPTREAVGGARILVADSFATLVGLDMVATWVQTVLLRRRLVGDLRFPGREVLNEDFHYLARAYLRARAAFFPEPLVEVRRHGNNSFESGAEKDLGNLEVLEGLQGETLAKEQRVALSARIGRVLLANGRHHFWQGSSRRAASNWLKALTYPGARMRAAAYLAALPFRPILPKRQPPA